MRECHSEVEQEDVGRLSSAQDFLWKSTDFMRRIIIVIVFRLTTTFGGSTLVFFGISLIFSKSAECQSFEFLQAGFNGGSNSDSIKGAKCLVI